MKRNPDKAVDVLEEALLFASNNGEQGEVITLGMRRNEGRRREEGRRKERREQEMKRNPDKAVDVLKEALLFASNKGGLLI
jgi:hypothetical protein